MGLYKLNNTIENIENAYVERVINDSIDYERYIESWLENSPALLLDDEDETNTILWIGRQVTANIGETDKFPDLIGIDSDGNLVVVEIKRGKTPREVIAQILEYATWGSQLEYEDLNRIFLNYYVNDEDSREKTLIEVFTYVFNLDEEVQTNYFNKKQKLYIVAEQVTPTIRQVSEYLRNNFKLDINHLEYQVLKTKSDEYFLSVEKTFGYEQSLVSEPSKGTIRSTKNWSGDKTATEVIQNAVKQFTNGDKNKYFVNKDIVNVLIKDYPEVHKGTVNCQLVKHCVNKTSRRHYPGGQSDLYFFENKKYRLYDAEKDGKWDWKGERVL